MLLVKTMRMSTDVLKPGVMLMSKVQVASEGLVWLCGPTAAGGSVCGLCFHQKPCKGTRSVFLITVKTTQATFSELLMTTDKQFRGRGLEDYCDNPKTLNLLLPPKANRLDRKPMERTLKRYDVDAEI